MSGYIWTTPLRSGPCQVATLPLLFTVFRQNHDLIITTFPHDEEECVLEVSGFRTHVPVLPFYSSTSFISLSCCSCCSYGIVCETLRPSRGERAYAHLCLSHFLSSWHVCPPPPCRHLWVFLCPFCRCSSNVWANIQLLANGCCWRANGHNQRWRPTAAPAKGLLQAIMFFINIIILRKQNCSNSFFLFLKKM